MKKFNIHVASCDQMINDVSQLVKVPNTDVAVISIGCPGRVQPLFDINVLSTLYLDFDDIDSRTPCDDTKYILFNKDMAKEIFKFVDWCVENSKKELLICVHCDAGISRSPAVALALIKIYNKAKTMPIEWNLYNRHVYSIMMNEFHGNRVKFI